MMVQRGDLFNSTEQPGHQQYLKKSKVTEWKKQTQNPTEKRDWNRQRQLYYKRKWEMKKGNATNKRLKEKISGFKKKDIWDS